MSGVLVVLSGTGTSIGKTHLGEALLLALARRNWRVAGIKPVESGVGLGQSDAEHNLDNASTFHVKHQRVALPAPLSPHLAARLASTAIDADALVQDAQRHRIQRQVDLLLLELPGGLFTPLTDTLLNADFAARLLPDALVIAASDRLGVLHDALALHRAATAMGLGIDALALVDPEHSDASTGSNASELARFLRVPIYGPAPRATAADLSAHPEVVRLTRALRRR